MPHKRNPIVSERITGIARLLRSNSIAALENVALWHERDISHSSVERVLCPDVTITLDFALSRLAEVMDGLVVYPDNMLKNIYNSGGIIFSQRILLKLTEKGLDRQKSYHLIQQLSHACWQEGQISFIYSTKSR
jgi:adenylosuccinate lyase